MKKLEGTDELWEVRAEFGGDAFRLLGFWDAGSLIILTNGFAKKTQTTRRTLSPISLHARVLNSSEKEHVMRDQDTSPNPNCGSENLPRDEQGIRQEKPSHMNQGNQTFRPDQQKNISSDRREKQGSGQSDEERSRKAS